MPFQKQYTNEEIKAALTETKGLIYLAAKKLRCAANTIRYRMSRSPEIVQLVADLRQEFVDTGEASLYRAVVNGEPWAVALVLKTLGKDRGYVERTETRQVSNDEINDEIRNLLGAVGRNGSAPPPGRAPRGAAP
jgi:hypothetical protein